MLIEGIEGVASVAVEVGLDDAFRKEYQGMEFDGVDVVAEEAEAKVEDGFGCWDAEAVWEDGQC